jgi:MFS family permease
VLALVFVLRARAGFPVPSRLEHGGPATAHAGAFTRSYWLYMIAGTCFAAGLMSFEFVSYHLSSSRLVSVNWIPALLALATVVAVAASLVLGRAYDAFGIGAVIASIFSPLVFLGGSTLAVIGLLLWGVGYAVQDTLLKALIASVLPEQRRNAAFGVFYLGYGAGWLVGSVTAGLLYDRSRIALVAFAVIAQLLSLPFFVMGARQRA